MVIATMEGPELLIVLVIVLLVFGSKKLPELARSLGEARREFDRAAGRGSDADHTDGPDDPGPG